MGLKLVPPTVNQIVTIAIAIVILGFIVKMLPDQYRQYFRI